MAEPTEGPPESSNSHDRPPVAPGQGVAPDRVTDLWRLLDNSPEKPMPAIEESAKPTPAGDELGGLLARAWYDVDKGDPSGDPPPAVAADWDGDAGWQVDRLPTAAEGGVAAMFTPRTASRRGPAPAARAVPPPSPAVPEGLRGASTLDSLLSDIANGHLPSPPTMPGSTAPTLDGFVSSGTPTAPLGSQPPAWGPDGAPSGIGRARLTEMIDQLPGEPTPRVRPEDVHVDTPIVAPVAIWFWGDDDIYAGRVATTKSTDAANGRGWSGQEVRAPSPLRRRGEKRPEVPTPTARTAPAPPDAAPPTAPAAARRRRLAAKKS